MLKVAEVWGFNPSTFLEEVKQSDTTHIVLNFLNEINYNVKDPAFNELFDIAPVTILTPYLRELPKLIEHPANIINWETYWFNRTYNGWKYHKHINEQKNLDMFNIRNGEFLTDFKYPYITLNNISKQHRCLIMDLLAKHNLIELGAIAWRDIRRDCDDIRHTFPEGVTDSVYLKYPYKYWKPKRLILDQDVNAQFLQETLPIEFSQSFMQLVTESDENFIFFTEKTATPILLNKPFLIAGAVNFHNALKSRGFELYTELFDYSFDTENNIELRYEGIIENVKRISMMSRIELENLHKKVFEKLVYNKQHAIELISTLPKELVDLLAKYPNQLNNLL